VREEICSIPSPPSLAHDVNILDVAGNALGTIHFEAEGEGHAQRLTAARQAQFRDDFCRELTRLAEWAVGQNWRLPTVQELQIVVSDRFRISKSLVPAWNGCIGYMEFPARRVIAGNPALMHELVHVFFPNGNRFLAEGLAVHLQAEIGGNPGFPNFGKPLHALARELVRERLPAFRQGHSESLERVQVANLDRISTPSPLTLHVGSDFYGEEPRGQAFTYSIAGSFTQFLVETFGMGKFQSLYMITPLVPHEQRPGTSERWNSIYAMSLADLETEWKALMVRGASEP
jgi:hypothetical protein